MDTKIQTPIYFLFSGSFLPNNGMSMIKAIEINRAHRCKLSKSLWALLNSENIGSVIFSKLINELNFYAYVIRNQ
tara:strand:+ start:255 stop:479 length:225 start_codon:yes stop_codon:yes gene_type:complete